ncbi:MAG: phenylalanine--tRNA ligase beta subunit-related protein [Candidatus Aminicenantaceae bacterium]
MKFKIVPNVFEEFPGLTLGVVFANQVDNEGEDTEVLQLIREKEKEIRANYNTETLSQIPRIESWRRAYSSFGAKPKKYKSSVESLYRMILKGVDLRHINNIVDIYNYISVKHMIPAGGDDRAKVEGDIVLKFADGEEPFVSLNSREKEAAKQGEVIYMDDKEVLCRRWNWRECDKTKMTEETKEVVLVIEGLPPVDSEDVLNITEDLCRLIREHCKSETQIAILDKAQREVEI